MEHKYVNRKFKKKGGWKFRATSDCGRTYIWRSIIDTF